MVIVLSGNPIKRSAWGSIGAGLGKGLGEGMEIGEERREAEKQKKEAEQIRRQENEFAKRELGIDLSGVKDPKIRQELAREAYKAKLAPKMYKDKYDARLNALKESPLGKYFSNGQQKEHSGPRQDIMNDQGEIEVGNISVPTMAPESDIFNAELLGEHGLAQQLREKNKQILEKDKNKAKEVTESYKENKDYINKTYDQYEDSNRREAILDKMEQLENDENLSDSGMINLLETMGLNPEWLKNPANEEYTKLALDLLGGGSLQADYGSRVLQSEFKVSLQRIPTLLQTPEGRRQIRENIKAMLLPSRLKQERLQYYTDKQERTGEPLPHNLRGKVLKDIKPQLEEAYDKFKQRNGRYKVKEGTFPDDNILEKYFFIAGSNEEKALKMMKEDGYDIE